MSKKKKQHYVPKFYMKNFSDSQNKFYVYDVEKKTEIGLVPYKSQCQEVYFYGEDEVWENQLSKMESQWAVAIDILKKEQSIDASTKKLIKQFALYQRQRTLGEVEFNRKIREELSITRGKMLCDNKKIPFDEKAESICKEYASDSISPAKVLQDTDELLPILDDLGILVLNYKTKTKLLASDVPIIAINPFHPHTIGYSVIGLILLFPITSDKLVVIYDDKMYPRFKGQCYITSKNEKEVHNLNVLQLISAQKILFCSSPLFEKSFNYDEWDARNRNRMGEAVTTMGTSTQKLIAVNPRKTFYNCSFSFGKVSYSFDQIPYPCREAAPRQYDAKWQKKLESKGEIMGAIFAEWKREGKSKLSQKEIVRGCNAMLNATENYWQR